MDAERSGGLEKARPWLLLALGSFLFLTLSHAWKGDWREAVSLGSMTAYFVLLLAGAPNRTWPWKVAMGVLLVVAYALLGVAYFGD